MRDHVIFAFLCPSLSIMVLRYIHDIPNDGVLPFYGWVAFHCIPIPQFFNCSSTDEHLGYFHILDTVNNAVMNMNMHVMNIYIFKFVLLIYLDKYPEEELLDHTVSSVSWVAQSCQTLCDPMNRSKPVLPVHHQLPEFTQTHIRRVGDAIQPSHMVVSF